MIREIKYCVYHPDVITYRQANFCRKCYDRHLKWKQRGILDMTTERYYKILEEQNGKCLFCGREPRENRFFDTDHDHKTGKVRGLLCNEHNRAIGIIEKNIDLLPRFLEYIK